MPLFVFISGNPTASTEIGERPFPFCDDCRQREAIASEDKDREVDYTLLEDVDLCRRLKARDEGAWKYVLDVLTAQEHRSAANNRKRQDWGVDLEALFGQLYEDMIGRGKLDLYEGRGSLIGYLRTYLKGYLNNQNPALRREQPVLDAPTSNADGETGTSLGEKISSSVSVYLGGSTYGDEDQQLLRNEQWDIAQKCFRGLWLENSVQAYVMLLKLRFHMSSVEIRERLGISSVANVDQLFSRGVKRMQELKVKYER